MKTKLCLDSTKKARKECGFTLHQIRARPVFPLPIVTGRRKLVVIGLLCISFPLETERTLKQITIRVIHN